MKTSWFYAVLSFLIFFVQSDAMARTYHAAYAKNNSSSRVTHWNSSRSSSLNGGVTSSTNTNPQVDTGDSSNDTRYNGDSTASGSCATVQGIIGDMTASPSVPPPPYTNGWPHVTAGIKAPSWANSVTSWGVVYRFGTDTNTAVEARNIRTWLLHKNGQWELFDGSTDVGYGGYKPDFSGSAPLYDERVASDGGVVVRIPDGSVYHFWPSGWNQKTIDTSDLLAIYTAFQARLVVNDPSKPDDTSYSTYVASAGADYYGNGKCCYKDGGEIGNSRFKYVTPEWAWYSMITLPSNTVAANDPPLECD
jgi:hypothetical protein